MAERKAAEEKTRFADTERRLREAEFERERLERDVAERKRELADQRAASAEAERNRSGLFCRAAANGRCGAPTEVHSVRNAQRIGWVTGPATTIRNPSRNLYGSPESF